MYYGHMYYGIFPGPSEMSVIRRCPYYRDVHIRRGSTVSKKCFGLDARKNKLRLINNSFPGHQGLVNPRYALHAYVLCMCWSYNFLDYDLHRSTTKKFKEWEERDGS
jgi:hypothetical protein